MVLTTSTEIDEEDASRKPWKIIWITYAGTLLKCAPEQLRYSSERSLQLPNMGHAQRPPWDSRKFRRMAEQRRVSKTSSTDASPNEEDADDDPELEVEDASSAAWEHETRQVERKLEM